MSTPPLLAVSNISTMYVVSGLTTVHLPPPPLPPILSSPLPLFPPPLLPRLPPEFIHASATACCMCVVVAATGEGPEVGLYGSAHRRPGAPRHAHMPGRTCELAGVSDARPGGDVRVAKHWFM